MLPSAQRTNPYPKFAVPHRLGTGVPMSTSPVSAVAAPPPQHRRRRGLILTALSAFQLMVVLDASVVNVALPSIRTDLAFSATGLSWVLNAYTLTFGGLLLLGGRSGDILGRK